MTPSAPGKHWSLSLHSTGRHSEGWVASVRDSVFFFSFLFFILLEMNIKFHCNWQILQTCQVVLPGWQFVAARLNQTRSTRGVLNPTQHLKAARGGTRMEKGYQDLSANIRYLILCMQLVSRCLRKSLSDNLVKSMMFIHFDYPNKWTSGWASNAMKHAIRKENPLYNHDMGKRNDFSITFNSS